MKVAFFESHAVDIDKDLIRGTLTQLFNSSITHSPPQAGLAFLYLTHILIMRRCYFGFHAKMNVSKIPFKLVSDSYECFYVSAKECNCKKNNSEYHENRVFVITKKLSYHCHHILQHNLKKILLV